MTIESVVLNEIQKVRSQISGYSNILIKGDPDFDGFINSFDFGDEAKDIYMVLYKRLNDIHFRMLMLYNDKIVMNDYELKDSDGFDKAMNIGKQFLDAFLGGMFYDDIVEIDTVFSDLTDITNVTYQRRRGNIAIEFENQEKPVYLNMEAIKEKDHKHSFFSALADLIMNLSVVLNERDQMIDEDFEGVFELERNGEFEKVLIAVDNIIDNYKEDYEKFLLNFTKANALNETDRFTEAQRYINIASDLFHTMAGDRSEADTWNDYQCEYYAFVMSLRSDVNFNLGNYDKSLWEINDAFIIERDNDKKADYKESREEILDAFVENLGELDFHKRKVIFLERDLPLYKPETILPMRIDKLGDIMFPPSHPVEGELYVGHPFQPTCYYPVDGYEQMLFESQFVELNHLLQCLGATEIKSEHVKGSLVLKESESNSSDGYSSHKTQRGDGGNKVFTVDANRDVNRSNASYNEQNRMNRTELGKRLMSVQKFSPKKAPYIPEDLVWFHHNDTWQKLAQQRLQGELNYYELIISTNSVVVINEREKNRINSEYKSLISGGYRTAIYHTNAARGTERSTTSEQDVISAMTKEDTNEWKLIVNFAPVEELVSETISLDTDIHNTPVLETAEYSENELKYIDDIKFAIEDDGKIDDDERRMLERNQARYNISVEKAKELEDEVLKQNEYTAEELEFIEEVNFILDHDGDIDDGDRRILLRLASRLGIAEQRAKELEEGVLMSREASPEFTEQEQQYIEELNFCLEDGPNISRGGRRLLDKTMKSLGISEERASEIEEVIQAKYYDPEND